MCIFRIFATKNTANLANFDPTPTLTGVSNQKTSVFASEYTKTNSPKVVRKRHRFGAFFVSKRHQKTTKNTPNLQIQKENNKKLNEIRKQRLTMLPIMVTMLPILVTLGNHE